MESTKKAPNEKGASLAITDKKDLNLNDLYANKQEGLL